MNDQTPLSQNPPADRNAGPPADRNAAPPAGQASTLNPPPVDTSESAHPRNFGSDNWAGAHPEVIAAITEANVGHTPGYGGDPWTSRFGEVMKGHFGPSAQAFPVFNGTGANVLALQSSLPRWAAVITAASAHINYDETGAPEKVGGLKVIGAPTRDGKLTPEIINSAVLGRGNEHNAQPLAVSISQSTEWGTTYTPDEIRAIADTAHGLDMILHVDGSRLGNAAAHLDTDLGAITTDVGVDIISLGGTKNGLLGAEAIVVRNSEIGQGMKFLRKMNLQLSSKMRFLSAQLNALYEGELWRTSANHANAMATRLADGLAEAVSRGRAPDVSTVAPVESNVVFVHMPADVAARARQRFAFANWPMAKDVVRLMCAFDTTADDVDALIAAIAGE
ncbi:MAG: beta-eliminating lyase-related protein [Brevibacterium sp.]|uniref:threonine aldolase family protein n=1 Tax=Brevibacterium sp. TaxID=1701 RepID=UPI00264A1B4F|nr:beta-eliminating lyase-related protein [Brevibacterium sp.]MDN5807708.1 beta-eliminating lyase-related protein [Brevibacterium sp.]MDN5832579.1 beta-eliminating lyase-related protein [Brevibacterium sp.]MDN5875787.1 beta-eliminating lyase-related protein [Brevibacterium sp.]MDN5909554.1 beta-eliminating lyase-related protein [Brevibacterium sp.]MDN6133215.1 beta-eliminating lyase-related protein [Brevibacterium sp.]